MIELSSDSEDESSDSDTCSESFEDDEALGDQGDHVESEPSCAEGHVEQVVVLARNSKTKIIHECRDRPDVMPPSNQAFHEIMDDSVTMCGRTVGSGFALVLGHFDWTAKCRVCFKGRRNA